MLSSLLPGLRHLRAPLIAGYVWLIALWIAAHPFIPPTGQATGVYREVMDLANWAGKPLALGAITMAAYIFGIFSAAVFNTGNSLSRYLFKFFEGTRFAWVIPAQRGRVAVRETIRQVAVNKLCERYEADEEFRGKVSERIEAALRSPYQRGERFSDFPDPFGTDEDANGVRLTPYQRVSTASAVAAFCHFESDLDTAVADLDYAAPRLLGKEDQLYEEFDRMKAEGVFRISLFLPLLFLFVVLAIRVDLLWLFGLIAPIALLYLGSNSSLEADRYLAVATVAGRLESPPLERLMTKKIEFAKLVKRD